MAVPTVLWAVALAATASLGGGRAQPTVVMPFAPSNYQALLDIVTTIVEQDEIWSPAFDQPVYHRLDRTWYGRIVDEELLEGALYEPDTVVAGAGEAAAAKAQQDKGDAIVPMRFLRNVMRTRRYRIGSVLESAVEVLRKSLTCVAYKHTVHLLKLIRVEISRTKSNRKALSWSGKAISTVAGVVIKMAGLRHVDALLLQAAAFLDMYSDGQTRGSKDKFDLTPALDNVSRLMLEYIGRTCVRAPANEHAVAAELGVYIKQNLYHTVKSKSIDAQSYKSMIKSIMEKMAQLFDALPGTVGMPLDRWNEILHFKRNAEEAEHYEFYRITRR